MSTRNLSPEVIALIIQKKIIPVVFIRAEFPSGTKRIWTGRGTYTDSEGATWVGAGSVLGIEGISESVDTGAQGLRVQLDGLDPDLIQQLTDEDYQGGEVQIDVAYVDPTTYTIVVPPEPTWLGVLDTDEYERGSRSSSLVMMCENEIVDILRKREYRYSDRDQSLLFPNLVDTGLSRMAQIQDLKIPWGKTER